MNKNKLFNLTIFLLLIFSIITNVILYSITKQLVINIPNFDNFEAKHLEYISNTPLADKLISKSCIERDSNVYMTECAIDLLDITAAQREWKQRKLEAIKHPQINTYDLVRFLEEGTATIKKWRIGFENMRDTWCDARIALRNGSGIPREQTECKIEFELLAIKDLNAIYYDTIMAGVYDSQGIPDFEPTKEYLEVLEKTNKTTRGCIWAGEDTDCN